MIKTKAAIIGAGPAGTAAAVQLKRYGIDFVIFERDKIGGLAANANLIENYPGFPHGISGGRFVALLEKHFTSLEISLSFAEVRAVDYVGTHFIITADGKKYASDYLIIASGTEPLQDKSILIKPEAKPQVFYEIAGAGLDNVKRAAVIGGGDAAFDYALNLSGRGIETEIFIRGDSPNALALLVERAANDSNITVRTNCRLAEVNGSETLNLKFIHKSSELFVKADCIFFAIGRHGNIKFLTEKMKKESATLQEKGKLFFTGDVKNDIYRQTTIAAGDGLRAAMRIYKSIEKENESNRQNRRK